MIKLFLAVFLLTQAICSRAQNYDEQKVPAYHLPDVLKTTANKKVATKYDWERNRRPEILTLFENNIYGQVPKSFDSINYRVVNKNDTAMQGKAVLKEVVIEVFNNRQSVKK